MTSCQEASFAHGTCRLTIEETLDRPTEARFVVHVSVVSEDHTTSRPLVFDDASPVEIHGASQPAVENNAITFCERVFGAFSQTMHACEDFGKAPSGASPITLAEVGGGSD